MTGHAQPHDPSGQIGAYLVAELTGVGTTYRVFADVTKADTFHVDRVGGPPAAYMAFPDVFPTFGAAVLFALIIVENEMANETGDDTTRCFTNNDGSAIVEVDDVPLEPGWRIPDEDGVVCPPNGDAYVVDVPGD